MLMPIGNDDEVTIKDPRQVSGYSPFYASSVPSGPWFVVEVCGVAARIAASPLSLFVRTTPLSNLRRAEVDAR